MKKSLSFLAIIIIGLLTACSNDTNQYQEVISNYPETIKENIEELPEEFRENIVVPLKLPESYSVIDFGYTSEPINDPDGNIVLTNFIYAGNNSQLLLNTMYGNVSYANEKSSETVTLDNGIEAKVVDYSLRWEDQDGNHHELSLIVPPDTTDTEITIEDLIEIANSME
ncbi:hypothetical protein [Oceanobacillus bengalensis]|uniref:DUF4367 domain-containing protein n=1 Tax=Oceanobacillus bengalensis TaxID=1435466 RepID=A0A494Z3W7_9BACI|nr:hypothetical protein [Oceanobacillus bengalensis]RKQ17182.1 hypothetical protein D8M05_05830 [Oceanobacillus bengalensis]